MSRSRSVGAQKSAPRPENAGKTTDQKRIQSCIQSGMPAASAVQPAL